MSDVWRDNIGCEIEIGSIYQFQLLACIYFIYVLDYETFDDHVKVELIYSRIAHQECISVYHGKQNWKYEDVMVSAKSLIFEHEHLIEEFKQHQEFKEATNKHKLVCI